MYGKTGTVGGMNHLFHGIVRKGYPLRVILPQRHYPLWILTGQSIPGQHVLQLGGDASCTWRSDSSRTSLRSWDFRSYICKYTNIGARPSPSLPTMASCAVVAVLATAIRASLLHYLPAIGKFLILISFI